MQMQQAQLATAVGRASKALAQSASAFGDSASASAWGATALGRWSIG